MKKIVTSRTQWVKPRLESKPLEETRAGTGRTNDGVFEMQS